MRTINCLYANNSETNAMVLSASFVLFRNRSGHDRLESCFPFCRKMVKAIMSSSLFIWRFPYQSVKEKSGWVQIAVECYNRGFFIPFVYLFDGDFTVGKVWWACSLRRLFKWDGRLFPVNAAGWQKRFSAGKCLLYHIAGFSAVVCFISLRTNELCIFEMPLIFVSFSKTKRS